MSQQTTDFNDFTIEKNQYRLTVYRTSKAVLMDLYFRDHRETAIRFLNETFEIIQNNKELTSTMESNIRKAVETFKSYRNEYTWLSSHEILKALRENYEQSGL